MKVTVWNALWFVCLAFCLNAKCFGQEPEMNLAAKVDGAIAPGDTFLYRLSKLLNPTKEKEKEEGIPKPTIKDPGPDTSNFPNGPYTLPQGRTYIEMNPFNLAGKCSSTARTYTFPFLIRHGITDDVELRLFSNGLTALGPQDETGRLSGFSPLVFDMKFHIMDENKDLFLPAIGFEAYLQSTFGSSFLNTGVQPALFLLFSKELTDKWLVECSMGLQSANFEITPGDGFLYSLQWAATRKITDDVSIFVQGFYNDSVDPRFSVNSVAGFGAQWNLAERVSIFGSYNFGLVNSQPPYVTYFGMAFAL
jgi:Putative MetA-pathway of phenol degradation